MVERRQTSIAFLVFAFLAAALLHQALLPGRTLVPLDLVQTMLPWDKLALGPLENPLISDPFYSFYPRRAHLTTAIQNGELPLWNPTILTGTPEIANPNFQLFYPPNLLAALFLKPAMALPWLAWAHLTLTGLLMFLFLRRHHLGWFASILGGGVWLLNGYTLVWLENPHRLSTSAWMPGLFLAYEITIGGQTRRGIALGALCLGMAILGGQMQFVLALGMMFGLYSLIRWLQQREMWVRLWAPAGIGLLGIALGTIAILPATQLAVASQRVRFDSTTILETRWSLNNLIRFLVPDYYGNPVDGTGFWGQGNYVETLAYFGAAALLLAILSLLTNPRSDLTLLGWLGMGLALALTLGTPLARLVPWLPGGQFIALNRLLILTSLCGSWLAATGFNGWLQRHDEWHGWARLWRLLGPTMLLLLIGLIAWQVDAGPDRSYAGRQIGRALVIILVAGLALWFVGRSPWIVIAIMGLVFFDLWQWGYDFNPVGDTAYLYPETDVISLLREDGGLHRVQPLQAGKVVFGPNVIGLYGLAETGGYTPLIGSDYEQLMRQIEPEVAIDFLRDNRNMLLVSEPDPLLGLLNVKYYLSANQLDEGLWSEGDSTLCNHAVALTDAPLTSEFVVTGAGFNRLDVGLASHDGTGRLLLTIEQAGRRLVGQFEITLAEIAPAGPVPLFFAPVPGSAGQTFTVSVRSPDNGAVQLCLDEEGELVSQRFGSQLRFVSVTENGVWVYENLVAQPRAFMVHHVVLTTEPIVKLTSREHDWHNSALIEPRFPATLGTQPLPTLATTSVLRYERHLVEVAVQTPEAGVLVLADSYAPGWVATIDGETTPIYRTNGVQRGVMVPAGAHQITFRYQPTALYLGAGISLLALLIAGAMLFDTRRIRKWR